MDFEAPQAGSEAAALVASILDKHCTSDRLRELERSGDRFDPELWRQLAESGLVSLTVPESCDGAGLGILELIAVLEELGRKVAPLPLGVHAVTAMAIERFGEESQQAEWLPGAATGESVLTAALAEDRWPHPVPGEVAPSVTAENDGSQWLLSGVKEVVPAGTRAALFVVPVTTTDGVTVLLVRPDDPGVTVTPQTLSGAEVAARLELDRAAVPLDRVLGTVGGGTEVVEWIGQHLTVALCAEQLGTVEGALTLTSTYAKEREQFGRPIGTFQAVSQRLADGYIDVLGARLTLWQAAWQLSERMDARDAVAVAKLWAADAGHRLAHTTVHVHGGVGIDLDGEAHRYFTSAKRHELDLGGTTDQSRVIGALLADA